jgi:hypothetical protein
MSTKKKAAKAALVAPGADAIEPVAQAPAKATKAKGSRKAAKPAKAPKQAAAKRVTKADTIVEMLQRKNGASIAEIMKATDWQQHSVRGFLAGTITKKMGLKLASEKIEGGERRYSVPA